MAAVLNQEYADILVDNALGLFALLDAKGKIIKTNQQLLRLRGLKPDDVIGKTILEITNIDITYREVFQQGIETVLTLGQPFRFENQLSTPQGTSTVDITLSPVHDEEGQVIYIVAQGQDISQQKMYEKNLAEEQAFVKAILDNTADAILVFNAQGEISYGNEVANKLFGLTNDQKIKSLVDVFDFYTLDRSKKLSINELPLGLAIKGQEVEDFEEFVQLKDNSPLELTGLTNFQSKSLSASSRVIREKNGEIVSIVISYTDISEKKKLEQKFIEEQTFSNVVLNNTADGIFAFDTEGKLILSNSIARELFYFDHHPEIQTLTADSIFEYYNLDETRKFSKEEIPFYLGLQGKEVKNFELLMKLQDNLPDSLSELRNIFQPKYLSISTRIITNDNAPAHIVLSYSDITEQTKATQAQAVLQERFSHAFDNAVIGIAIFSSRGIILEANQSLCSTLGYEQDELLGKSLADITHPDDMTLTEILFSEIESGISNSIYYEKKLKHKKGLPLDSILGISVSRDSEEQINYIIAHILDVTENNKISKALALSQKNYQSIFNSQLDAVIVTNLSGKILNINPSAVKLFGYNIEDIDGLMLWELFSAKEDRLALFENLYAEDQEKIHTDTIRYTHRNGDAFPAETVGFVIYDGDGKRLGYTWIIQDVSEKKIAEITLARINQRLAVSREEERRRLARELHDGIVQDLMGFSYELASLEGLLDRKDDFYVDVDDLKDMRSKLTNSIKQLRSFISDLRPVGLEEFGFQSALESYVALLERDRQSMRAFPTITLKVDDVGELPIPINLCLFRSAQEGLTNIIRHSKAKNVTISLALKQSKELTLVLTIKDDGIGFKVPEDINDFSDTQNFGLIGINERVTLMDGQLAIKSQKNKGTTLTLTLPYETEL